MRNLTTIGLAFALFMTCFSVNGQLDCAPLGKAAFVRSNVGHPWDDFGVNTFANLNTMDEIWGANVWADLRYETLDFPSLLQNYDFIYLEGGDDNAIEMQAFLNQHLPDLEAWVFAGGRLLVNAAPNEGGNIYCGFGGVEIIYDGGGTLNYDAIPMDVAHPVFTDITSNYFDGNYMGHSLICPPGMSGILRAADSPNDVLLAEMDWGDGKVVFGGLTLPWYEMNDGTWGPQPDLSKFGFQVIQYSATGELDCPPDCLGVPGGDAYIDECGECVGGLTGLNPCILGCIDPTACNYDPVATDDDGSCEFIVDCAGECGGNSIYDDCGTCYDPDGEGITTEEYYYTGQFQTFTVPEGVDSLIVEIFGAQGGKSTGCGGIVDFQDDGGYGGYATGVMLVNPGEVYYLYVGGQGGINGSPGWNGGGIGGTYGGGGGGASDIRTTVGVYASRLVVAGGGGGGQYGCGADYGVGGPGGGLIGGDGIANVLGNPGFGGTQVSGGVGGTSPSSPGSFGTGGSTIQPGVAGGGGGWYGGGSAYQAGGGGGSSYLGNLGEASTVSGIQPGNGLIRIQYEIEIPICIYDCNGELNGTAYLDECGVCVEGATGLEPCIPGCTDPSACNYDDQATDDDGSCEFVIDCNGVCGGTFISNECGDCYDPSQGGPDCVLGCDGNYYTDPDLAPQFDCAGICGGNVTVDDCGVCGGDNSSCTDCAGVVNGNNILDACGNCYDPALIPIDSTIFDFTGAVQIFNVPSGVSTLYIEAYGAQGANAKDCDNVVQADGGLGGFTSGELIVAGGETLYIYVGGAGVSGGSGGWNGGGAGGTYAGGGGGASDVRGIIGNLNSRMIVAGGGGAGSTGCPDAGAGGSGGGLSGAAGVSFVGNIGGGGGTQVAGGAAGSTPSAPGSFGLGGGVFGTYVAGGGGGWYGGGSAYQAGGGGGSSYIGDLQNVVTIPGVNSGNGQVKVYYQIFPECTLGCTDPNAINYNPQATDDDGSCLFAGCTDPEAVNYNPDATEDDGSCLYDGCTNPQAENYDPQATIDDGSCIINGCTDPNAENYNVDATVDDGSCEYLGCTNPAADNYNPAANVDDGSCIISGCMAEFASNYNPDATIDDGTCECTSDEIRPGCMDPQALNFQIYANQEDGSCVYDFEPSELCGPNTYWDEALQMCLGLDDCPADMNNDLLINAADLLVFLSYYGLNCQVIGE